MKKSLTRFQKSLILVAFGVLLYWVLQQHALLGSVFLWGYAILKPFLLGFGLAFVLNLPMRAIEGKLFKNHPGKPARALSFLLTLILVLFVLGLVILLVVPEMISTITLLARSMPSYLTALQKQLAPLEKSIPFLTKFIGDLNLDWSSLSSRLLSSLQSGAGNVFSSVIGVATTVVSGTFSFVISIIFSCYLLLDKERLTAQLQGLCQAYLSKEQYSSLARFTSLVNATFSHFFAGQGLEAILISIVFVFVLSVGRFHYALLIGVLVGAMSLIPIFGAFIACAIGALLILISQGALRALAFLIVFLIIQQIDGNFMYPFIVGNSIGLPPIWVLVAVSLGGSIAGIGGLLLFIPLCSVIYTLLHQNASQRLAGKGIASPAAAVYQTAQQQKADRKKRRGESEPLKKDDSPTTGNPLEPPTDPSL